MTRHFAAYHNVEKMGHPLRDGDPLQLHTNKPVSHLRGGVVWFITGEGTGRRRYRLGSVFEVDDVGDATDGGFQHYAKGPGRAFDPPLPLDHLAWWPSFLKAMSNFSRGPTEIRDDSHVKALIELARQAGWEWGGSEP